MKGAKNEIIEAIDANVGRRLIAERVADILLKNGGPKGETGERLMIVLPGGRDGGGWSRESLTRVVEGVLSDAGV